jgi:hypothetical protein
MTSGVLSVAPDTPPAAPCSGAARGNTDLQRAPHNGKVALPARAGGSPVGLEGDSYGELGIGHAETLPLTRREMRELAKRPRQTFGFGRVLDGKSR